MDLWVAVAAATAGYVAKYWQNLRRDRDPDTFVKLESSSSFSRLARSKHDTVVSLGKGKKNDERLSNVNSLDSYSNVEVASTSGYDAEKLPSLGTYEDCNVLSLASLPPVFSTVNNINENWDGGKAGGDIGDRTNLWLPDSTTRETNYGLGFKQNRHFPRTKSSYGCVLQSGSSLQSCVMSQLYKEQEKIDEFVIRSLPSLSIPMRSLLVTDGRQVISRASTDLFSAQMNSRETKLHKEAYPTKNRSAIGVPPLSQKMKLKAGKRQSWRFGISGKTYNGEHLCAQDSPDGLHLFILGLCVGMISSAIANKPEVDKLKELLKQTENLVHDLHDELEMKDSLTVKELADEDYELGDTSEKGFQGMAQNAFFLEENMKNSAKYVFDESYDQKAEEDANCMSKIEAELEAELERLALNMHMSDVKNRLSDLVELDPDFEADFAQGELRADLIRDKAVAHDTNQNPSSTSTTHLHNHAVSPRELSLRLHEVLQSRLEERVKELEMALGNNQKKGSLLESQSNSWKDFLVGKPLHYSIQRSPISNEDHDPRAPPLVMNLSGDALDAYNETYEELMKMNESEEENSPFMTCNSMNQADAKPSVPLGVNGDEDSNSDDERESDRIFIKQIVERTKKRSFGVLKAHKILFSVDEI